MLEEGPAHLPWLWSPPRANLPPPSWHQRLLWARNRREKPKPNNPTKLSALRSWFRLCSDLLHLHGSGAGGSCWHKGPSSHGLLSCSQKIHFILTTASSAPAKHTHSFCLSSLLPAAGLWDFWAFLIPLCGTQHQTRLGCPWHLSTRAANDLHALT